MPLRTRITEDGHTLTVAVRGRFDFNLYRDFRSAYEQHNAKRFIIDLKETDYIDSSALGMLLVLRERYGGDHAQISILNSRPEIKEILTVSNFDKMFDVH